MGAQLAAGDGVIAVPEGTPDAVSAARATRVAFDETRRTQGK